MQPVPFRRSLVTPLIAAAVAAGGAITASAPADTVVGGPLFADTTWDLAGSPYVVTSSVLVGVDATLTIDPGVEVRIGPGLGISVGSEGFGGGTLVARGTAADPIVFTSSVSAPDVPAAGDWNAITFTPDAEDAVFDGPGGPYLSGSALEHCVVEFAGGGGTGTGSVTLQQCRPWIAHVTIRDSARAGILGDLVGSPPLRIESSAFRRCSGVSTGGGVHLVGGSGHVITDCTFDDCTGSSGAGMLVNADAIDVIGCGFTGNDASSNGGGLYADSASSTIEDNVFTDNEASSGGGLFLQGANNAVVDTNLFTGNAATNGGGLRVNGGTDVAVTANVVTDNTAGSRGGGLYLSTASPDVIDNEITGNEATGSEGGGAWVNATGGSIVDNLVVDNVAATNGGGLVLVSGNGSLSGNAIEDNAATNGRGGGLYVTGTGNQITGGTVTGNTAGTRGGGADVTGASTSVFDVVVTGNSALVRGGGFAWSGTGGSLAGESRRGGACNTVSGNVAPVAPAIWYDAAFAGDGSADLDASFVCWGTEDPALILESIHDYFDDGSRGVVRTTPYEGGPILVDATWTLAGSPYVVMESVILGNDATLTVEPGVEVRVTPGRAISFGTGTFGPSSLVARGTAADPIVFTSNLPAGQQAAGDWVGLFLGDGVEDAEYDGEDGSYLSGAILEHCVVEFAGGGNAGSGSVTAQRSAPAVRDVTIRDSARAGLLVDGASAPALRLARNAFRRCTGVSTGGGLHLVGGSGHLIEDCVFEDNSGSSGGGVLVNADAVVVTGMTCTDNVASSNGGGLYLQSTSAHVSGSTFTGNSASSGGGMFLQSSDNATVTGNEMTGNAATNGGGLRVNGGSAVLVEDNELRDNVASSRGGGLYASTGSPELRENLIQDNQALNSEGGGAWLNLGGAGLVVGNQLLGNVAATNGGGAVLVGSGGSLEANVVSGNSATTGRGGGIRITGNENLLVDTDVTDNLAGARGGGLDVTGSSVTLARCRVTGNEAILEGGGLHWTGTAGSIAGSASEFNVVADNVAPAGAAVWYGAANGSDLAAENVCWDLFDGGAITAAIHDFFDDSSLGLVLFFPFIDDPGCAGGAACPADLDGDGAVDFDDLLAVLGGFGASGPADIDGSGEVDFNDLLTVLGAWGACP